MKLLIVAAALSNWSYDGFVSDPPKPQPAAPQERAVAPPAAKTSPPEHAARAEKSAPAAPAVKERKPAAERWTFAPDQSTSWRLADSSGQVWEHTDSAWLSRWVADRNAQIGQARGAPPIGPPTAGGSVICTPSGCYRTTLLERIGHDPKTGGRPTKTWACHPEIKRPKPFENKSFNF